MGRYKKIRTFVGVGLYSVHLYRDVTAINEPLLKRDGIKRLKERASILKEEHSINRLLTKIRLELIATHFLT
ncbi:hypothetical protein ACO1PF_04905 [Alkalibacterium sp. f15]|uniref:hypothetical protein n=1 Tax=Alkalibacterium sp. f15 TaxID=3414029 RepID=UPI003BF781C5